MKDGETNLRLIANIHDGQRRSVLRHLHRGEADKVARVGNGDGTRRRLCGHRVEHLEPKQLVVNKLVSLDHFG